MLSINEGIKRALAIVISWCSNNEGTRQKSQERLKSDLGLWLLGISARKNNNRQDVKWMKHGTLDRPNTVSNTKSLHKVNLAAERRNGDTYDSASALASYLSCPEVRVGI